VADNNNIRHKVQQHPLGIDLGMYVKALSILLTLIYCNIEHHLHIILMFEGHIQSPASPVPIQK
jgi:hypothetical protein